MHKGKYLTKKRKASGRAKVEHKHAKGCKVWKKSHVGTYRGETGWGEEKRHPQMMKKGVQYHGSYRGRLSGGDKRGE